MTAYCSRTLCIAALFCFCGCSGGSQLGEVEGTVTLSGKPLANVRVEFIPDRKHRATGPRSTAMTDAQGHYVLQSDDGRRGAAVGAHLVVITFDESWQSRDLDPRNPSPGQIPVPRRNPASLSIPARYTAAVTTPLRPEVRAGKQTIDLTLVPEAASDITKRDE